MEKIYTIPVNEAFDECAAEEKPVCPFCRLENRLEENELDLILGASMMEPDVRLKTNEEGFCQAHFARMLTKQKRLPLALMLESHLESLRPSTVTDGVENLLRGPGTSAVSRIARLEESCYLCRRIGDSAGKMLDNAAWLWEADEAFRKKTRAQKCLCLPHTRAWLEAGKKNLAKKQYAAFCKEVGDVCNAYFDALRSDVSKYCRKFDYRYEDEPWGEAKDAPERAIRFLVSDRHSPLPEKKKQT